MKTKTIIGIGALALGMTFASPARADLNFSISFGLPLPPRIVCAPVAPLCLPVVAPVIVAPRPVVCPSVVVVRPRAVFAPAMVVPRPVVIVSPGHRRHADREGWRDVRWDRDDRDHGHDRGGHGGRR